MKKIIRLDESDNSAVTPYSLTSQEVIRDTYGAEIIVA